MYLYNINSVTTNDDTFTKCYITGSEGAVYINSCSSKDGGGEVINSCQFLICKATSDSGSGICAVVNNLYNTLVSNSLFSECSDLRGGTLWLRYYSSDYTLEGYPLKYCFFHKNTCGAGNEVTICADDAKYIPTDNKPICFWCFSTTILNRVGYRKYNIVEKKYEYSHLISVGSRESYLCV